MISHQRFAQVRAATRTLSNATPRARSHHRHARPIPVNHLVPVHRRLSGHPASPFALRFLTAGQDGTAAMFIWAVEKHWAL
eukprot:6210414-Pleurochrysis_carterae.AAC.2